MQPRPPPGPPVQKPPGQANIGERAVATDAEVLMLATAAHILPIFTSVIGPAVVYVWKKDEDPFIRYHATQAMMFAAVTLGVFVLSCGTGSLLVPFFWMWSLWMGLRAKEGEWCGYPFVSNIGLANR